MENALLASELVKGYHKDGVSPRCVMKIDIAKAFDSVQWEFVLKSLKVLGFLRDLFIGLRVVSQAHLFPCKLMVI